MRRISLILALALLSAQALAEEESDCGWNASHTFFTCGGFHSGGFSDASAPTVSDTVEQNPASLPTIPTPFQLELSYATTGKSGSSPKVTFNGLKGFQGLALGVGRWSNETFANPDVDTYFQNTALASTYTQSSPAKSGTRISGALGTPARWLPKGYSFSFGVAADPGVGALVGLQAIVLGNLGFGVSTETQKLSPRLPSLSVTTYSIGAQIFGAHAGYQSQILKSSLRTSTSSVFSVDYSAAQYAVWVAQKWEKDAAGKSADWSRFGVQYRPHKRVGVSYEYGRFRYSHALGLQVNL